jgi:hypothetical protein
LPSIGLGMHIRRLLKLLALNPKCDFFLESLSLIMFETIVVENIHTSNTYKTK